MNIFLEAAHLSLVAVLRAEFWIPQKQEAAASAVHSSKVIKRQKPYFTQSYAQRQVRNSGYSLEKKNPQ